MVRQFSVGLFAGLAVAASSVSVQLSTEAASEEKPVRRVPKEGIAHASNPVRRVQEEKQIEFVVGQGGLVTHDAQQHAGDAALNPSTRTSYGCSCIEAGNNNSNYCYTHGSGYDWCYVSCTGAGTLESAGSVVGVQNWDYCVKRKETTHGFSCRKDGTAESTCGNWCENRLGAWALGTYAWCETTDAAHPWDYCVLSSQSCANIAGTYKDGGDSSFTVSQTDCQVSFTHSTGSFANAVWGCLAGLWQ